jgi:hypothetical protein
MKLLDLLNRANQGYPEEGLAPFYDSESGKPFVDENEFYLEKFIVTALVEGHQRSPEDPKGKGGPIEALMEARTRLDVLISAIYWTK